MSVPRTIIDEGRIPAGYGAAYTVCSGETLAIINTYGNQVADIWAFTENSFDEYISMDHTRSALSSLIPREGDAFYSNRRRPLLCLEEDTSPGIHDTLLCPCNSALYVELGAREYHRSCEDNLHEALACIGRRITFTPASFNAFMNVRVTESLGIVRADPVSRAGDRIVLKALENIIVVVSACPQDITRINGSDRTPRPLDVVLNREHGR